MEGSSDHGTGCAYDVAYVEDLVVVSTKRAETQKCQQRQEAE